MSICPTCGQQVRHDLNADALLGLLRHGVPHREVYLGRDHNWYVTYGGGTTTAAAVNGLLGNGLIHPVYDNLPSEAFHVGDTLAMEATLLRRKETGDRERLVYTNGTIGHIEPRKRQGRRAHSAIKRALANEITQADAAREMGVSRQRVHQIIRQTAY